MQTYSKFKRDYSAKKNQVLYKIKKIKNKIMKENPFKVLKNLNLN